MDVSCACGHDWVAMHMFACLTTLTILLAFARERIAHIDQTTQLHRFGCEGCSEGLHHRCGVVAADLLSPIFLECAFPKHLIVVSLLCPFTYVSVRNHVGRGSEQNPHHCFREGSECIGGILAKLGCCNQPSPLHESGSGTTKLQNLEAFSLESSLLVVRHAKPTVTGVARQ